MKFLLPTLCCLYFMNFAQANSNKPGDESSTYHYSGFDKRGNFYRGNKKTGFYYNYGTGETCFGNNQQRKCYMAKN